jgi:hypothetical protein
MIPAACQVLAKYVRSVGVGAVICQQTARVIFAHDVVETLAPDRSDQPFDMTVCHDDCGVIGRSQIPMVRSRRVTAAPYDVSRFRIRSWGPRPKGRLR